MIPKNVLLPALVAAVSVMILSVIFYYGWEGDSWDRIVSFLTILPLIIAPSVYFLKRGYEVNNERKRASRNLFGELYDTLSTMNSDKPIKDLKDIEIDGRRFTFTNRFLNHDIYDALVFSGKIEFLRFEAQQQIQDVFRKIKAHNYYLRHIDEINDQDNEVSDRAQSYYKYLDKTERQLIDAIPSIMDELKKEFGFKPPS